MDRPALNQYVLDHTGRTACECGRCIVSGGFATNGTKTVKLTFFDVFQRCADGKAADRDALASLIRAYKGVFCDVNPLDGKEHNYMELGGWLGDQETALRFIGLCDLVGVGKCLSPDTIMPSMPDHLKKQMAGAGMVSMQAAQ